MELERRIRFLCSRRATLELETLLTSYFEKHWEKMSGEEREKFARVVSLEDPVLEGVLFRGDPPPPGVDASLIESIRFFRK